MGHKTITISEEAYKALAKLKLKRESFTEAILRLTRKRNTGTLLEYVRSLEPDEELARILEEIVEERKKITLRAPRL
jgi:predicted CopG family antitoxin